ncbi:RNA polymerase sigma factor [Nocardiopsis sp. LOL_012]|uniref:RNA polymerase sigma factor n=1 Tax=Nocardiopsis sp. LOL_012 TaxID=3345409 RepID=UPI003A89632A
MRLHRELEDLLRDLAPQVLAACVRHHGHFDVCEDAVQESLLAAVRQWPRDGVPDDPRAWLVRVASRRTTDHLRSEWARRRREVGVAARRPVDEWIAPSADAVPEARHDDTLVLLFLCCHPALSRSSQIALTLRAVGGLTTAQIAHAFLVPEPTMAQRISRAKRSIRAAGAEFRMPQGPESINRLDAVLHVLYLIFNEGYTASSGARLQRAELTGEAIRLTRVLSRMLPEDGEVAGLLALMLLNEARRPARTTRDGALVPLAEQDRGRWDREAIAEGVRLVSAALAGSSPGPYQLQAAIAAVHAEARRPEDTDWPQILALYGVLERFSDSPMVALNHAVAASMVRGPRAGLERLRTLDADPRLAGHHRLAAARAHLLEMDGDRTGAREQYRLAARRTTSIPERDYLRARAERLA